MVAMKDFIDVSNILAKSWVALYIVLVQHGSIASAFLVVDSHVLKRVSVLIVHTMCGSIAA